MVNPGHIKEEQTAENHPAEAHSFVTVRVQWEPALRASLLHLYVGINRDFSLETMQESALVTLVYSTLGTDSRA